MPGEPIQPTLHFFSRTPANLAELPPLASSLQSLESCFISIRFHRYPDALMHCVTAWESAIKAALKIPPGGEIRLDALISTARELNPALKTFDAGLLAQCRQTRNRIVHYGYSPKDDEECARQLLRTGIPFLEKLYIALFDFYLLWQSLLPKAANLSECGEDRLMKVGIAPFIGDYLDLTRSYFRNTVLHHRCIKPSLAFLPFAHFLARNFANPTSSVEHWALTGGGEDIGILWEAQEELARRWESQLAKIGDYYQRFQCPICSESDCFFAIYREDALDREEFGFRYGRCLNCEFFAPEAAVGLTDLLLKPQLTGKPNPA